MNRIEDVFLIENGDIPVSYVSFQRCNSKTPVITPFNSIYRGYDPTYPYIFGHL